jgi:hypothetical protein
LEGAQQGRTFNCQRCGVALVTGPGGHLLVQPRQFSGQANPFAEDPAAGYAPGFSSPYGPGNFVPYPVPTRDMVLRRVLPPAIVLMVCGGFIIIGGLVTSAALFSDNVQQDQAGFIILSVLATVLVAIGGLVVFSGVQMRALRSYALVLGVVIVMMLVGFLICPVFALPGVWPMIVLLDPGVRANFGPPPESPFGPIRSA